MKLQIKVTVCKKKPFISEFFMECTPKLLGTLNTEEVLFNLTSTYKIIHWNLYIQVTESSMMHWYICACLHINIIV